YSAYPDSVPMMSGSGSK
nr:Chain C, YSA-GSGSK-bio peptide [synthetic construct]6NJZ_D Chain D, YSA-GSGSK-bio peptide [synthetic construct]